MRTLPILAAPLALFIAVGCEAKVATVEVIPAKLEITSEKAKDSLSFAAKDAKGGKIEGKTAVWSSSDPKVVAITPSGQLSVLGSGVATITAKVGEIAGSSQLTVVLIKSLKIDPERLEVGAGAEPKKLSAVFLNDKGEPVPTNRPVIWTVKDPAVATVAQGNVTGVAQGTTQVEAAAGDLKAVVEITVTAGEGVEKIQ